MAMTFQEMVSKLENMILTGNFQPRERLVEATLAERFQVSRYWIRDALKILATKGLVEVVPFKGAFVVELNEQEIKELYVIRVTLEQLAVRMAATRVTREEIKILNQMVREFDSSRRRADVAGMILADTEFHDYCVRLADNETLRRLINDLRNRCYVLRYSAWSSPELLEASSVEHHRFIEFLAAGEADQLADLTARHLCHTRDHYLFQLKAREAFKQ